MKRLGSCPLAGKPLHRSGLEHRRLTGLHSPAGHRCRLLRLAMPRMRLGPPVRDRRTRLLLLTPQPSSITTTHV